METITKKAIKGGEFLTRETLAHEIFIPEEWNEEQKMVAQTIATYHQGQRFDFAITLGDNFYSVGMESPSDSRWKTWFEDLYGPLGIPFYASLGNQDWGHPDSPAAEILYSGLTPTWRPMMRGTSTLLTATAIKRCAPSMRCSASNCARLSVLEATGAPFRITEMPVMRHDPWAGSRARQTAPP